MLFFCYLSESFSSSYIVKRNVALDRQSAGKKRYGSLRESAAQPGAEKTN